MHMPAPRAGCEPGLGREQDCWCCIVQSSQSDASPL